MCTTQKPPLGSDWIRESGRRGTKRRTRRRQRLREILAVQAQNRRAAGLDELMHEVRERVATVRSG